MFNLFVELDKIKKIKEYEIVTIVHPNIELSKAESLCGNLIKNISDVKIIKNTVKGLVSLSYPIRDKDKNIQNNGIYIYTEISAITNCISSLNNILRVEPKILRHRIFKV